MPKERDVPQEKGLALPVSAGQVAISDAEPDFVCFRNPPMSI